LLAIISFNNNSKQRNNPESGAKNDISAQLLGTWSNFLCAKKIQSHCRVKVHSAPSKLSNIIPQLLLIQTFSKLFNKKSLVFVPVNINHTQSTAKTTTFKNDTTSTHA
jgi:hypothetical protein